MWVECPRRRFLSFASLELLKQSYMAPSCI